MISWERLSHKLSLRRMKWLWIGLAALPALRLYYVREMVAALMIFSVLFAGAALIVLIFFLLDIASQRVVVWMEAGVVRALGWVNDSAKDVATPLTSPPSPIASSQRDQS